jgi:hypothetical protein
MRTFVILFATLLTATAAAAGPRSLSTGEPTTVELPPQRVQVLEAPQVQLAPAPTTQADTSRTTPAQTAPVPAPQPETKATETTPAPVQPAPTAVATPPAASRPTSAAPTVQPAPVQPPPAIASQPPATQKQATVQRKPKQRQAGVEQHIHHELRGIERTMIGLGIGAAISYGAPYYW